MANERELERVQAKDIDLSLGGVLHILTRRSTRGGERYSPVGELTDSELIELSSQLGEITTASLVGLQTFGSLLSSHDKEKDDLDANGVGWLVSHLAQNVSAATDLSWCIDYELSNRGLSSTGLPLHRWAGPVEDGRA